MKLSKAVLAASGIGLSTQFSFGSITVSVLLDIVSQLLYEGEFTGDFDAISRI